ncbi:MAG: hypothetical protein QNJ54_07375 [Prochloraceae cyanobacterium]|nr:hypothetical protein [Prochloraceae cyanobacterium]
MSSLSANQSGQLICLIDYYDNNTCLLGSLLEKWQYKTIRITVSDSLTQLIKGYGLKPDLIILNIVPAQKNVTTLIESIRLDSSALSDVPLLCLCSLGGLSKSEVMRVGASDALNKPFELEELDQKIKKWLKLNLNNQQVESHQEMTLLVSETESSSLLIEQEYWLKVFEEHQQPNTWELLMAAGYEVKPPMISTEDH